MSKFVRSVAVERPRILFLEASTGLGGSGSILFYMLSHMDRGRFDVRFSSYLNADTHHLNAIKELGIPYAPLSERRHSFIPGEHPIVKGCRNHHLRRLLLVLAWIYKALAIELPRVFRLVRTIKSQKISIVVTNNDLHFHLVGVIASRIAGVPCIVRKAGGIGQGKWVKRLLTGWVDAFVPISNATKVDQLCNPATKRVVLIPGGVDLTRFDAEASPAATRAKLGLPECRRIIGSAARLVEGKGQEEFIRAAAKVAREYPDVIFYVAGSQDPADPDAHVLEKLQDLARELGISDEVIFGGWRDDMPSVLAALDIFVHCPTTFIEGLCITNLEAMASGKPTIISENGGMPDAVVDGVTGFIVPPGDIDALAQAMLRLLRDPELARHFGRNARKRIEEKFEIGAIMRAYERLFAEFAVKASRPSTKEISYERAGGLKSSSIPGGNLGQDRRDAGGRRGLPMVPRCAGPSCGPDGSSRGPDSGPGNRCQTGRQAGLPRR